MGLMRFGFPSELGVLIKENFSPRYFVETGTYKGDTALWAAGVFDQVITIEASQAIYEKTRPRLAGIANIDFRLGDSPEVLQKILPTMDGGSLFWLDSHWMGENTAGSHRQCPLIQELELLAGYAHEQYVIIDDAELFLCPPPMPYAPEQWPTIDQVIEKLKSANPLRYIIIFEDTIIAVPPEAYPVISSYCQERQKIKPKSFRPDIASIHIGMELAQDGIAIAMRGLKAKASRLTGGRRS